MSWEIVEHTADVRIHVQAATLEALFADSLRALMEVMRAGEVPHPALRFAQGHLLPASGEKGNKRIAPRPAKRGEGGAKRRVRGRPTEELPISHISLTVDAPDLTALLVDFLNEVLARVHTQRRGFEPESIVLDGLRVRADLRPLGTFEEDVKAVTYHEADVRRTDGGWTTTLVLDI